jgi:hypothetical protein
MNNPHQLTRLLGPNGLGNFKGDYSLHDLTIGGIKTKVIKKNALN